MGIDNILALWRDNVGQRPTRSVYMMYSASAIHATNSLWSKEDI